MEKSFDFYPFNYPYPERRWIYKNRCVLKVQHEIPSNVPEEVKIFLGDYHLCGYVTLPKTAVPKDWWGNYEAPGLTRLAIHGNLTYCQVEGDPNQKEILSEYRETMENLLKKKPDGLKALSAFFNKKKAMDEWMKREFQKNDEGYVVFGFDCNHLNDHDDPNLKDPNHVMMLTEQMEQQLLDFAERYQEYIDASKNPATENFVQTTIIREILRKADFKTKIGFGGMLNILTGKDPGDDQII